MGNSFMGFRQLRAASLLFISLMVNLLPSHGVAEGAESLTLEREDVVSEGAKSAYSAAYSSYYFDMYGVRGASSGLYGFRDLSVALQLLTLNYKPTANWTISVIGQHIENSAVVKLNDGKTYTNRTSGAGDTTVMVARPLAAQGEWLVLSDASLSIPTGSITIPNRNFPNIMNVPVMLLGTGTFDTTFAVMPLWMHGNITVGSRLASTFRAGRNSRGYRMGDQHRLDTWAEYNVGEGFFPRVEAYYLHKESMNGSDPTLPRSPWTEFFHNRQTNYAVMAGLRFQRAITPSVNVLGQMSFPFWENAFNYDRVFIRTRYFAFLGVNGTF